MSAPCVLRLYRRMFCLLLVDNVLIAEMHIWRQTGWELFGEFVGWSIYLQLVVVLASVVLIHTAETTVPSPGETEMAKQLRWYRMITPFLGPPLCGMIAALLRSV